VLNERQDYFGQTVNIAARVQGLAHSRAILATGAVVGKASKLLEMARLMPLAREHLLRGLANELTVYEIP
jgi:class 3 adenylate cyclase